MWLQGQGLDRSIMDGDGRQWFFKIWHDTKEDSEIQKIYFWDSKKEITGMVEFKNDQTLHIRRIKDRIIKLTRDKSYRDKFLCKLQFPIEKDY